jgi:hypothetical protein
MGPLHTALDCPSTRLEEWSLIGSAVDCELNSVKACACGSSAIGLVLMLTKNVATRRVENIWKAVIGGLSAEIIHLGPASEGRADYCKCLCSRVAGQVLLGPDSTLPVTAFIGSYVSPGIIL